MPFTLLLSSPDLTLANAGGKGTNLSALIRGGFHVPGGFVVTTAGCALIICLPLRMRLSRPRIQEFLQEWLGIALSVGCINQCIREGGRAAAPLEPV